MAHTTILRTLSASLGLLVLAGCGAQPTLPVAPKVPAKPPQTIELPNYDGTAPGAPAAGDAKAQQLLAGMVAGVAAMKTATYTGTMYCRGSKGSKPKALKSLENGEWEATSVNKIAFKRPGAYRCETTQCTNPTAVGMKFVVHGDNASIRLPGVLGLVKLSLTLGDQQMRNFRGHRLDDGTPEGIAKRLANSPDARFVGELPLNGRVLDLVEIPHAPSFDPTIDKEVIGIDRQTKLPLLDGMFTKERKVYEMKLSNVSYNGAVPSDFDGI